MITMVVPGDQAVRQTSSVPHNACSSPMSSNPRSNRVLSCALCQQRKVKCDRNFPCANCRRSGAECLSTPKTQPRRRRFAERELLDRLRNYEELLRQRHVDFKPLHTTGVSISQAPETLAQNDTDIQISTFEEPVDGSGNAEPAVDFVHAVKKMTMEPEDEITNGVSDESRNERRSNLHTLSMNASRPEGPIDETWQCPSYVDKNDINRFFLFETPEAHVDISSLHPDQAEIFRLWQIYLENVDPLLKCTHNPTLQARIIDALGHLTDTSAVLQALLFSIYCVSTMSLGDSECLIRFGSARQALLAKYQHACQQALLKCKAWCSEDMDALTALYLYTISLRPQTDPRSLSTILAILMRNAQRMRLHDEASNAKYLALEAEIRRRLWWSLVSMDHRICELSEYKTSSLTPLWDCRMPLNVNDFELRSQMKVSPLDHDRPTEALFPFLWSRLINSLRHSDFHLNFINPALHALRRPNIAMSEVNGAGEHEAIIEKHLVFCQADDPLGFMTIWTVRGHLARHRLLAYYAKHSKRSAQPTKSQRGAALSFALEMLECDTKIRTSPLTKNFLWFANLHIPIIAYFHIINHARRHPNEPAVKEAWRIMRDHWNARVANRASKRKRKEQMTFESFVQSVRKGWDAFGAALKRDLVSEVLEKENFLGPDSNQDVSINDPVCFDGQGMSKGDVFGMDTGLYSDMAGQSAMEGELAHFWTTMDWSFIDPEGW